jgi:hypothetical protein
MLRSDGRYGRKAMDCFAMSKEYFTCTKNMNKTYIKTTIEIMLDFYPYMDENDVMLKLAISRYPEEAKKQWLPAEDVVKAWDKLMEKTDCLHDLDCGSCDKDVEEFIKAIGLKDEVRHE